MQNAEMQPGVKAISALQNGQRSRIRNLPGDGLKAALNAGERSRRGRIIGVDAAAGDVVGRRNAHRLVLESIVPIETAFESAAVDVKSLVFRGSSIKRLGGVARAANVSYLETSTVNSGVDRAAGCRKNRFGRVIHASNTSHG